MIRTEYFYYFGGGGIPRESGDDPDLATVNPQLTQYSPRERG